MTLLVLDLGSSSARAALYTDQLQAITVASEPYRFETDKLGASTVDPIRLQDVMERCIDSALRHPAAATIRAVGIATFAASLLGVDRHSAPLTEVYTYADTRAASDLLHLGDQVDLMAAYQRTGCPPHTAYHPARLSWLRRVDPSRFEAVQQWIDFGTYLMRQWFGIAPCSYSIASWSGLFDRVELRWDEVWLNHFGLTPSHFPPLADYTAYLSGLRPEYADRWPALRAVPFFLPVGDGAAANVGAGAVESGQIALTLGTTGAVRSVSAAHTPIPAGLWAYRVDATHHLIGGATSEGGNVFAWLKDHLRLPDADHLENALAAAIPDSHGLTWLPFLAGERSPGWRSEAVGTLHGLRLATPPIAIVQAALEGIAIRLALIAEQLGPSATPIRVTGGALSASPAWTQMIANAIDRPLAVLAESAITSRGVALLTLCALEGLPLHIYPPNIDRIIMPQSDAVSRLRDYRARQQRLYDQIMG